MRLLAVSLVPVVALIMGVAAPQVWAWGFDDFCVEELDEAEVFFEFNSTDCDVGIQFFWDGVAWKWMIVKDRNGRAVLDVFPLRNVKAVGLTEGRFEGDEPQLIEDGDCDLNIPEILDAIEDFIGQYKDGPYTFKGIAVEERCLLLGDAELTYDILEPVVFTNTNLPNIEWDAPSELLFGGSSEVVGYEMVIELVVMENGDERVFKETTTLPGDATSYLVSDTFMHLIDDPPGDIVELKIEILADEESGNRTITEEEVELEEVD
jgi:hypothetical protein